MASLTHTAYISRKFIKYGGLGIGGFTVFYMLMSVGIAAYKVAHPPYVAPDVKFGMLPKIVFTDKKFDKKSFKAELPNDTFPLFKDQSRVYVITRPNDSFLALEQDTKTASSLGFKTTPNELKFGVYEFKNDALNQTLTMNVLDGSFLVKYPYESDQMLLNPERMPSKEEAISTAKSYLSNADKLPDDILNGEKKVSYWKITFDGLKTVSSLSDANVIRVDFFRKNLDEERKIISSDINSASVSVLVTGSTVEGKKIVEVSYKYANLDRELFSTYPIKTAEQAWADLTAGNYWPAFDTAKSEVVIRNMYLAYFEPISLTNYLQPVYVFEGDDKFTAYVPAVVDKYIK